MIWLMRLADALWQQMTWSSWSKIFGGLTETDIVFQVLVLQLGSTLKDAPGNIIVVA